jgi:DeoR/GlpR family transcriptional regulator of sugar metabolism
LSDDPELSITIKEIQNRFNTVYQTARTDLMSLEKSRLIQKRTIGKKKLIYHRSENFNEILSDLIGGY